MRWIWIFFVTAWLPAQYQLSEVVSQSSTVAITNAGDSRLFLVVKQGRVRIWDGSQLLPTDFINLVGSVSTVSEQGLLSIAFHPNYAVNGFVFAAYTDLNGTSNIVRFTRDANNPNQVDPDSERVLLQVPQPAANHNGGQIQFGPDGYLYYGTGDGGGGGGGDPNCFAQNPLSLLGKMLRLDVDVNVNTSPFHGIPADNPFVGNASVLDLIWAIGFRNPWRFSFDRLTGSMYIADVGERDWEEIDVEHFPSPGGANYGWDRREGANCFQNDPLCPVGTPLCEDPSFVDPVIEYGHDQGRCSITGGYVYRGCELPALFGKYIYGDYCSGEVWSAWEDPQGTWNIQALPVTATFVTTFGESTAGEIHLSSGGKVFRLDRDGFPSDWLPYWGNSLPCGTEFNIADLVERVP